jgi:hypothetical protein
MGMGAFRIQWHLIGVHVAAACAATSGCPLGLQTWPRNCAARPHGCLGQRCSPRISIDDNTRALGGGRPHLFDGGDEIGDGTLPECCLIDDEGGDGRGAGRPRPPTARPSLGQAYTWVAPPVSGSERSEKLSSGPLVLHESGRRLTAAVAELDVDCAALRTACIAASRLEHRLKLPLNTLATSDLIRPQRLDVRGVVGLAVLALTCLALRRPTPPFAGELCLRLRHVARVARLHVRGARCRYVLDAGGRSRCGRVRSHGCNWSGAPGLGAIATNRTRRTHRIPVSTCVARRAGPLEEHTVLGDVEVGCVLEREGIGRLDGRTVAIDAAHVRSFAGWSTTTRWNWVSPRRTPENTLRRDLRVESQRENARIVQVTPSTFAL